MARRMRPPDPTCRSPGRLPQLRHRHRRGAALLGVDSNGESSPPAGSYVTVSAGGADTCAIDTGGAIHCWGDSGQGVTSPPAGTYEAVTVGRTTPAPSTRARVSSAGATTRTARPPRRPGRSPRCPRPVPHLRPDGRRRHQLLGGRQPGPAQPPGRQVHQPRRGDQRRVRRWTAGPGSVLGRQQRGRDLASGRHRFPRGARRHP